MHKIKIIELTGYEEYDEDYCHGPTIYSLAAITDWDEVSDEDFEAIRFWANAQNRNKYGGGKVVLLEEKKPNYPKIVSEYIEKARDEKKKQAELELRQAEKTRKRELAAEARQRKLKAKKEAEEKAVFEKLKQKFEK